MDECKHFSYWLYEHTPNILVCKNCGVERILGQLITQAAENKLVVSSIMIDDGEMHSVTLKPDLGPGVAFGQPK